MLIWEGQRQPLVEAVRAESEAGAIRRGNRSDRGFSVTVVIRDAAHGRGIARRGRPHNCCAERPTVQAIVRI